MATTSIVGTRATRVEAAEKVTGELQYASDLSLPHMLYAKVLRSPHAHARIKGIDTARARAYPGVVAVITAEDVPNLGRDVTSRGRAVLAPGEALFYGQPVAAVAATDLSAAEEALDLIRIEYEELPAVIDPAEAMRPGSPRVRAPLHEVDRSEEQEHATIDASGEEKQEANPNISQHLVFSRGDVEQGFAEADLVMEHAWRSSMVHQGYIETHNTLVDYDITGQFTVWSSNRGIFPLRAELGRILGVPETRIRVVGVEPGGAFGSKITPLTEGIAATLARITRRPVKLTMSRSEDLKAAIPAPQAIVELKTGARKDGTLTAIQAKVIFDAGAFPGGPLLAGCSLIGGYYRWPNLHIDGFEVLTNKVSVGALRAPGTPQVTFAIESQMDMMAEALGLDPMDFRLKNAVAQGDLLPNNRQYPRIGLRECLERVKESALWQRRSQRLPNRGIGVAVGGWLGGMQPAGATMTLNLDGTVSVQVGSVDVTGVNTSFTQIAAEALGLPLSSIRVRTGDSSSAPYAGQSGGSKTLRTVGRAIQLAAADMLEQMTRIAAEKLEAAPGDLEATEGKIRVKGSPEKAIGFDLMATLTTSMGGGYSPIVGRGSAASPPQAPGFTCQAVEVQVDPDTGALTVLDSVCAQDVGFAVNPMLVEGQIQGGVAQSLAIGFTEELQFDEQGVLRNPSLLDYRMPTALDLPRIQALIVEVPSTDPLYGVRGVGEPPIVAGAAAIANAVAQATGARVAQVPATAERILRAMGKL
ncbi:MAG: xanthine dehydrogenase family protein molybdopterin-binding subunit [Chloroflexi bacterium]|nr:xanthine dehydrogenase family protein molybdopterin-binding subunit [Chloroflexota bacterium]